MAAASENPAIVVIACGLSAGSAADWWQTVLAAWPTPPHRRPTVRYVELSPDAPANAGRRADGRAGETPLTGSGDGHLSLNTDLLGERLGGAKVAVILAGSCAERGAGGIAAGGVDGGAPACDASARLLRRVIAELDDRGLPALLVARDQHDAAAGSASSHTAVVPISAASGREVIAGAAFALLCREPALDQVRHQLELERAVKQAAARELERHQTETAVAVMVQRAFIPTKLPEIPGLDAGVLYRPGGSLSGDMYDLVRLDEAHAGFFVADAMGHGVAAALLTMLVSRLLPMREPTPTGYRLVPPGEAMRRFNESFLARRADDSTMVTAVYGLLNLHSGHVCLASAGHPLPVVTGPRGSRQIDVGGASIGLHEDAVYEQAEFTLAAGESLLLYTDGFEWAFSHHEPTGASHRDGASAVNLVAHRRPNERYLDAFAELGLRDEGQSLGTAFAALSRMMDAQHGSLHQPDDITLLGITRAPHTQRASDGVRLAA